MTVIVDAQVRADILNHNGSIIVSASAGSGKTTIMIEKLIEKVEKITNHKTVAAVTFTNDAAQEIKEKLEERRIKKYIPVQTNDAFIETEIIRPFIKDAFDEPYPEDVLIEYHSDYKFTDYDEGIKNLTEKNVLGTYRDNKKNFKFELAKNILMHSQVAREYLIATYIMIFIDEYQDTDKDMHNLFMYIKNELNIPLFVVGDPKQAIYLWRGAQKDIFEKLKIETDMKYFQLITNFRSHHEIVNYANFLHDYSAYRYNDAKKVENVIHCKTSDFISSFEKMCETELIDLKKEITIISNINKDAKIIADKLNQKGYNFIFIPRSPLDTGSENSHILKKMSSYFLDKNYTIYDLTKFMRIDQDKMIIKELAKILDVVSFTYLENIQIDKEEKKLILYKVFTAVNNFLNLTITEDEVDLVFKTLSNSYYHNAFIEKNEQYRVMTVFGSKGLGFDQVLSFSDYYSFYNTGKKNNHYVCVTRAKEKFVMFEERNSNYSVEISRRAHEKDISNYRYIYKKIDH